MTPNHTSEVVRQGFWVKLLGSDSGGLVRGDGAVWTPPAEAGRRTFFARPASAATSREVLATGREPSATGREWFPLKGEWSPLGREWLSLERKWLPPERNCPPRARKTRPRPLDAPSPSTEPASRPIDPSRPAAGNQPRPDQFSACSRQAASQQSARCFRRRSHSDGRDDRQY